MRLVMLDMTKESLYHGLIVGKWKARHSIVSKKLAGEAASVNPVQVSEYKSPYFVEQISSRNIFNMDETGLFWKMLADYTLAFKKEEVREENVPKIE